MTVQAAIACHKKLAAFHRERSDQALEVVQRQNSADDTHRFLELLNLVGVLDQEAEKMRVEMGNGAENQKEQRRFWEVTVGGVARIEPATFLRVHQTNPHGSDFQ